MCLETSVVILCPRVIIVIIIIILDIQFKSFPKGNKRRACE